MQIISNHSQIYQPTYSIVISQFIFDPNHPPSPSPPLLPKNIFSPLGTLSGSSPSSSSSSTSSTFPPSPIKRLIQDLAIPPSSIDKRFGPIVVGWADSKDQDMTSAGPSSSQSNDNPPPPSSSSSQPQSIQDTGTMASGGDGFGSGSGKRRRRKNAFTQKPVQISTPVANFSKTDSFRVDDPNDSNQSYQGLDVGETEVAFGIVHLFKDREQALSHRSRLKARQQREEEEGEGQQRTDLVQAGGTESERELESVNELCEQDVGCILALLSVPCHLTASDLLSFMEPATPVIQHLRLVRDVAARRTMVLIKFRDASDAEDFHKMFNGQPFNSIEEQEVCKVVYVTEVRVEWERNLPFSFPHLSNSDPWPLSRYPHHQHQAKEQEPSCSSNVGYPINASYELPTCPVCLERMDSSITGLMTITCQHTFHCTCLSKWQEGRCPVCRYSQVGRSKEVRKLSSFASGSKTRSRLESEEEEGTYRFEEGEGEGEEEEEEEESQPSLCTVCSTNQDLWVCLICATVGCGRYKAGHAHSHFEETGHLYSLELETQRVWDYAGDGYVHRLIQNKADGKLVELPSASSAAATPERRRGRGRRVGSRSENRDGIAETDRQGFDQAASLSLSTDEDEEQNRSHRNEGNRNGGWGGGGGGGGSTRSEEKIEAIGLEYSYLLTSQLESQRQFYEEKLDQARSEMEPLLEERRTRREAEKESNELRNQVERLKIDLEASERERVKSERRYEKLIEVSRRFERELHCEREVSKGLMGRVEVLGKESTKFKAEVEELKEQVRDLMFFIDASGKIQAKGNEMVGGDLEIREGEEGKKKKGKGRKK
ncbi:hypothetical protein IE53DRAFT_380976 [Violaceomyces palustris]|uniref:Uncharacterized protein n=1 Tax=Violaceomyces palustris TaxID=1673888 RepID=A0ACD0NST1_9BASI|nr:hypothetical protein IE53DRAFT_380976 [Violaceomyces palustris]